jgi:hypothetical protein
VRLDVLRGCPEQARVVLELAEAAVAVEAEQGSDRARLVVVVDVRRRSGLADRAEATLRLEHRVSVLGRDPVPPLQVIRARPAYLRE